MTATLQSYIGKGLTPQQFIEAMTKNQDKFLDWSRRFEWSDVNSKAFFQSLGAQRLGIYCLILAADWCGDVVRNVPVVFHAMEEAKIPVEVFIMEQHLELMDQHLTMGGRSIPIVLFTKQDGELLGKWGPRPTYIQEPMVTFKQNHMDKSAPDYDDHLKAARAAIMERYGEDTTYQKWIVDEVRALLESILN